MRFFHNIIIPASSSPLAQALVALKSPKPSTMTCLPKSAKRPYIAAEDEIARQEIGEDELSDTEVLNILLGGNNE